MSESKASVTLPTISNVLKGDIHFYLEKNIFVILVSILFLVLDFVEKSNAILIQTFL